MSTVNIRQFFDEPKKVKFNDNDKINEISAFEETIPIEKNSDHLSKITEEDFKTEYGWSKLIDNQNENGKKKALKVNVNELSCATTATLSNTGTTNFTQAISWDYFKMNLASDSVAGNDESEIQQPQQFGDFTEIINAPLDFNTQKLSSQPKQNLINESIGHNDTITNMSSNIADKCNMAKQNYQICANISSFNTTTNASISSLSG